MTSFVVIPYSFADYLTASVACIWFTESMKATLIYPSSPVRINLQTQLPMHSSWGTRLTYRLAALFEYSELIKAIRPANDQSLALRVINGGRS